MQTYMTKRRAEPEGAVQQPAVESMPGLESSLEAIRDVDPHAGRSLDLDGAMAQKMQDKFGIRMDQVELRESSQAADMDAKAFAKGNVVQFAPGQFQPGTRQGQHLIEHELAHVAQQARGGVRADVPGLNVNADEGLEHQADMGAVSAGSAPVSLSGLDAGAAPIQGAFERLKAFFGKKKKEPSQEEEEIAQLRKDGWTEDMIQAHLAIKQGGAAEEQGIAELNAHREAQEQAAQEAQARQRQENETSMARSMKGKYTPDEVELQRMFQQGNDGVRQMSEEEVEEILARVTAKKEVDEATSGDYSPEAMSKAISFMNMDGRMSLKEKINADSKNNDQRAGSRFGAMRNQRDDIVPYHRMLRKAGERMNEGMFEHMTQGLESVPNVSYKAAEGDDLANYENMALGDMQKYLELADGNEDFIDSLRQSADFYSGLGEYDAESNPKGMQNREEALSRALNDQFLRNLTPEMTNSPRAMAHENRQNLSKRSAAFMSMYNKVTTQAMGARKGETFTDQEVAMRMMLQEFHKKHGLME